MNQRSELVAIASMLLLLGAASAHRLLPGLPVGITLAGFVAGTVSGGYSLVLWRREQALDPSTRALSRRYLRECLPAMFGYVAAVALSLWLLRRVDETWLRALIALLPVPPIAMSLRATARYIRGLDELQRRIELEAVALGSVGVAMAYLTGGLLQAARLTDVAGVTAMIWVMPSLCLGYAIAKRFVVRHYR